MQPLHPSKSSIFIGRVIDFEVFLNCLPNPLVSVFCLQFWAVGTSSWELWLSFRPPFGVFWDVLGPLGAKCSRHVSQNILLKRFLKPQNAARDPKRLPEGAKKTKKMHPKCPHVMPERPPKGLWCEGVAGDAPQALSIRPPPRGLPC